MIIELLVAFSIYAVGASITYESIMILINMIEKVSISNQFVEDFEDVILYMYKEVKGKELELIFYKDSYIEHSILLIGSDPVIAYQLFQTKDRSSLRRLVAMGHEDIHKLAKLRPGSNYFNTRFSGFNSLYNGKESISFKVEGNYITFKFGKLKTYIGKISNR
ncbi:hypothetical protein [Athalassotoga saccharophila]|uniref:hypothetical protein n=1 Tax=Athalassotoga saccharophila TaxID=1441386 RepID=UPI0013797A63|nr:hypothetical protein [Athalassotoga saccharophila]